MVAAHDRGRLSEVEGGSGWPPVVGKTVTRKAGELQC